MRKARKSFTIVPFFLALLLVAPVFFSCASTPKGVRKPNPVYLTNRAKYTFLAPSEIAGSIDQLQRVEGSYGDKNFSFLIYVKADSEGIDFLILNDFGTEVARVTLSPDGVASSGVAAQMGLQVEYILADFQLAYYKADCLVKKLAGIGLVFTERHEGSTTIREVHDGDKLVTHIEFTEAGLLLENSLRGYTYSIHYGE
jgi:hypothetical protein